MKCCLSTLVNKWVLLCGIILTLGMSAYANSPYTYSFELNNNLPSPNRLTTDGLDRIIVTDTMSRDVNVYDSTGAFLFEFQGIIIGMVGEPFGIATDSSNRIIAAFNNPFVSSKVQVFDPSGAFLFQINTPGWGVATDSSDRIIVSYLNQPTARVEVFDSSGNYQFGFGNSGSAPGEFNRPFGITTDSSDRIIVADSGNDRVQVFDSNGTFLFEFGSLGVGPGQFNEPMDVVTDSSDNIFVTDSNNNRIQAFDDSGTFLFEFGNSGSGPDEFSDPLGIGTDSLKRIIVADRRNERVQIFDRIDSIDNLIDLGIEMEEVMTEKLEEAILNNPFVADILQDALDDVIGNNGGKANNGAADKLQGENLLSALTMMKKSVEDLQDAEADGVDTTLLQELVTDYARRALNIVISDAIDDFGATNPDVLAAISIFDQADVLFDAGDYIGAIDTYKAAAQALP